MVYTLRSAVCYLFSVEAFAFAFSDVANSTPIVSVRNAPLPDPVNRRPAIRAHLWVNRRRGMEPSFLYNFFLTGIPYIPAKQHTSMNLILHTQGKMWMDVKKKRYVRHMVLQKMQKISWINSGSLIKKLPKESVLEKKSTIRKR